MTAIVMTLALLAIAYGTPIAIVLLGRRCRPRRVDRVQEVENAYWQTRQAMNDAAGQSWRNLAG